MLPILLSLGPIKIYSYGLMMAIAFLLATFLIWKLAHVEEIEEEKIFDLILVALAAGLVGARILYILLHLNNFTPNLIRIIHLTKFPGLAFQGGLILGTVAVLFFIRKKKLAFWQISDILVLGLSLAQAIARIGCFLNGCCYGIVTSLPWGVYFPGLIGKRQPTQLYESLIGFFLFFILIKIYRKTYNFKKEKRGYCLLTYFILSSLARFLIEFLRDDSVYWHGIKISQLLSGLIFTGSLIIFIFRYRLEIVNWFKQVLNFAKNRKLILKLKK